MLATIAGLYLAASALLAEAYIPALPTNDTNLAIQGGLNVTDQSKLHLQWFVNGSYWETVSYQLVGADSNGFTQGAIVHFSEDMAQNNDSTTTPWIALVSCDANATNASQEDDIFTLARDRGAVSALLYSRYSQACIINPFYADPSSFDQVMDIFSTQSLTSATLIEYQFGQFGPKNESLYGNFNPKSLNDSQATINQTIATGNPTEPGYLFATLQAYNATGGSNATDGGSSGPVNPSNPSSSNTGLAMIILYAITGCVSALFCVVIILGAIRAIRHPERYGPRAHQRGAQYGPGQSRARGLTRAILDTFPVVKFGQSTPQQDPEQVHDKSLADSPTHEMPMELHAIPPKTEASGDHVSEVGASSPVRVAKREAADDEQVVPDAIGRETCPICIVDFEEGDDLRVLPCEGKHKFHQQCVDPWLLELSSSCPICRQDFQALENMMTEPAHGHGHRDGDDDDDEPFDPNTLIPPSAPESTTSRASSMHRTENRNRFSRYLRVVRRRRDRRSAEEYDPTDPYMPRAPDTSM